MDKLPLGFFRLIGEAADISIQDQLARHAEHMHVPSRRTEPLKAVPFSQRQIPDVVLAQMVELLEEQGCSLMEVAWQFDYPMSLVERELADYRARWRRWLLARQAP